MIVPLGGSALMSARSSRISPWAVPAKRKRRFGYVWAMQDANQRSHRGKVEARP